jgi:excisionase family DNA binding protein
LSHVGQTWNAILKGRPMTRKWWQLTPDGGHGHSLTMPQDIPELLTYDEVAEKLRVKRRTVERYVADGLIAAIRPGYVERTELADFFARARAEGARRRAANAKAARRR